jgi:menaquinol-cytochrome c reductase iron-sulfur subunit
MKLFRKKKGSPKAQAKPEVMETRRTLLNKFGLGALLTGIFGQGFAFLRSLVPNVLYEEPRRFKVGPPDQFAEGATFLEDKRLFVFRERNTFYVISATCTHLGCTVKMVNLNQPKKVQVKGHPVEVRTEFHCPCHGSKFYGDGTNYAGPAPTPLTRHKVELAPEDGQLVVNLSETVNQDFRLTV